jgi:hypothetical protein
MVSFSAGSRNNIADQIIRKENKKMASIYSKKQLVQDSSLSEADLSEVKKCRRDHNRGAEPIPAISCIKEGQSRAK